MTARDDLERAGAEAVRRVRSQPLVTMPTTAMNSIPTYEGRVARAVLDALLASRDPDGNRMVILASELEQVAYRWFDSHAGRWVYVDGSQPQDVPGPPARPSVPVFVFRPPSGEG